MMNVYYNDISGLEAELVTSETPGYFFLIHKCNIKCNRKSAVTCNR